MKKILPYLLIILVFGVYLVIWHRGALSYRFTQDTVKDYLRSQDIVDPDDKIKDRIWVSDSVIYSSAGYLYATGSKPTDYNFQHPPLVKYLFGYSTLLTGNPFFIQIVFGLVLLLTTYYLGVRLLKNRGAALVGSSLLLLDPVFGGMINETLLDLGQAVFALGYLILSFYYPGAWLAQGIILGLFAASKFWSTALIIVGLTFFYRLIIRKEKLDYKKTILSFVVAFLLFSISYINNFLDAGGAFNIFAFLAKDLKFMLDHNSAGIIGGPIVLFVSGYFIPWWESGVLRAPDWSFLWPISLVGTMVLAFKTNMKEINFFFYLLPLVYLLLSSTQVPFTRYFIIILPFVYLALVKLILGIKVK